MTDPLIPNINNPHDTFFRELFERKAVAKDYMRQVFPPGVLAVLDLRTLTISKDSYVSKELRKWYSDLVYQVRYRGQANEQTAATEARIYLLFEHKSTPDSWVALQLLRYIALSGEAYRKQYPEADHLPPVYTNVLYHGTRRWTGARCFQDLIKPLPDALVPYVPQFCYDLYDISTRSDTEIKGDVLTRLALLALRYIYDEEPLARLRELSEWIKQIQDRTTALEILECLLRYYVEATEQVSESDAVALLQTLPDGERIMPTFIDKYRQQGMQQGMQQGEANVLLRLMQRKFGEVPGEAKAKIEQADAETLLDWSERILSAEKPEDVFH